MERHLALLWWEEEHNCVWHCDHLLPSGVFQCTQLFSCWCCEYSAVFNRLRKTLGKVTPKGLLVGEPPSIGRCVSSWKITLARPQDCVLALSFWN